MQGRRNSRAKASRCMQDRHHRLPTMKNRMCEFVRSELRLEGRDLAPNPGDQGIHFRGASAGVGEHQQRQRVNGENLADCREFAERGALHAALERAQVRAAGHVGKRLLAQAARFAGHLERCGEGSFARHP